MRHQRRKNYPKHLITFSKSNRESSEITRVTAERTEVSYNKRKSHKSFPLMHAEFAIRQGKNLRKGKFANVETCARELKQ